MKLIKCLFFLIPISAFAVVIPKYDMNTYDNVIQKIYGQKQNDKVADISKVFLGKPYKLGALGEGAAGKFDKSPLYRTDKFDCVTFVSTVLALVDSQNLKQFQDNIKRVRYRNGEVSYFNRNHFISVDWNKNNTVNDYLEDVTDHIADRRGRPVATIASAIIDKPNWYKKLGPNNIKSFKRLSSTQINKLLQKLHKLGDQAQQESSVILYIPLKKLFNRRGEPNMYLFKQIPSGSIIEIIRPNWDLRSKIGTHMNVSHLGLALRTSKGLIFREASSDMNKVVDVPLINYLKNCLSSPTIKGIHIQKIVLRSMQNG